MNSQDTAVLLFCVAMATAIAVRRLRVPHAVALVVVGLTLGSFGLVAPPTLTKELLFVFFLPGLLFESAFHLDFDAFAAVWGSAVALAIPGVVAGIGITAVLVGVVMPLVAPGAGIDWRFGLLFAALVAATDPVAVTAVFREVRAPERLTALIETESLFNDGTGIVFLTFVLSVVAGVRPSVIGLSAQFVAVTGGGVVVGLGVGFITAEAIKRVEDAMIEIALTTIAAYGAFVLAEQFLVSGVLATVVAGMVCAKRGRDMGMSAASRVATENFWRYVAFALNSVVFLLIGFQVHVSVLLADWREIFVGAGAMLAARIVIVGVLRAALRPASRMPRSWSAALAWGGLRGALSMVLALSIPSSIPNRDLLITVTVGAVVVSLIVQGLTMPYLIDRLGIGRLRKASV